jgi:hypothetical protein
VADKWIAGNDCARAPILCGLHHVARLLAGAVAQWRTEPEIDEERQRYLAARRSLPLHIEKGIYPFLGVMLDQADVEWLLVTHESGGMYAPLLRALSCRAPALQVIGYGIRLQRHSFLPAIHHPAPPHHTWILDGWLLMSAMGYSGML